MKQIKYLNAVLTVIAFCLVLLTCAMLGIIPKVNAGTPPMIQEKKFVSVPLNPDGSLNVKLINDVLDVNIDKVGGYSTYGRVPVQIKE